MHKLFLHKKTQAGQVVLIALILLGSLGLIGVSIATQTVLEQRKAVLEEKTQKAYYAAESGIEQALKQIKDDSSFSGEIPLSDIGGADASVQVNEAASGQNFNIGVQLNSGEPFYFNLQGYSAANNLTFCWDKAGTSFIATLHYTEATTRKTYYYLFNTTAGQSPRISAGTGNPATTVSAGANGSACGFSGYQYTLTFPAGVTNDYLVIWPLYQNQVRIGFNGGSSSLPQQGKIITSTGTIEELDGTITRRLKFFQSIRDYPSSFLQMPFYVRGGITFGPGKNWP
jgi:type II secretory pathway pseudopilin PulG